MFSIAAINDTDAKSQWEPLAPTKEAQEFHLSQTYHEGLRKLQSKDYEKARELLEEVLKDPILSSVQDDVSATDGHLLQLRFLALKNLATVFLQQGCNFHENALRCYLQAVEIDSKDSVVWNQLGTLSCSMGLLSISRWAFEQGLVCSPNNWNCMEKLLEVLIAIGDEIACLSVAELILRHWPSHSRALHVKNTIVESEPIPFAPRGIDKLEPKHVRLKFQNKRKATNDEIVEGVSAKKLNQNIDVHLAEATWTALVDALLDILLPSNVAGSKAVTEESCRNRGTRLIIHLPQTSGNVISFEERRGPAVAPNAMNVSTGDCNSERGNGFRVKEPNAFEEQPHERRSSRLERLRSRKSDKEELDFSKDLGKVVSLEPFVVGGSGKNLIGERSAEVATNSYSSEFDEVARFAEKASKNYGAYHVAHLLLEEVSSKGILYQDAFIKFLELEKLTRFWGQDRTPECSLFLSELYFDFGSRSSDSSVQLDSMSDANYLLCKIIEYKILQHPISMGSSGNKTSEDNSERNFDFSSLLNDNISFWVRYYWLCGQLSVLNGDKAKAQKEFSICLSLLADQKIVNNPVASVFVPHSKVIEMLTVDRVLHEITILEVDFLLKTVEDMLKKEMYSECVGLLAPLLFSTKDVYIGVSCMNNKESEGILSVEAAALDVLSKACEKVKPLDVEVKLKCHCRKLQILMKKAGITANPALESSTFKMSEFKSSALPEELRDSTKQWNHLVVEEVKAISQDVSIIKNFTSPCGNSQPQNVIDVASRIIGDIQISLLALMCSIVNMNFSRRSSGVAISEESEQWQKGCFVDAAIAFFKLQHLIPSVPVKSQIELIVAIHEMLAEYGLCCAGGDGDKDEGKFLKLAIKHLFALDMKLKSNSNSSTQGMEVTQADEQLSLDGHAKRSQSLRKLDSSVVLDPTVINETSNFEKETVRWMTSNGIQSQKDLEKEKIGLEYGKGFSDGPDVVVHKLDNVSNHYTECSDELTEDEREELELKIENALDQCFFCLYGLQLRSDSLCEEDLVIHKNTSRGDYQTKEQCADVFQYILPYAKASSKSGLAKLRRVLRAIRKHFPQPPENISTQNAIDKFLDDPGLCEDKLSEEAGSEGFLNSIMQVIFPNDGNLKQRTTSLIGSSEPYLEVYNNLYYVLALSEEMSATDKWPGFVLTKEGAEFVEQNANLFKYDLLYNPLRFESWQRLANIYDEEVDLLLNDGSKQINAAAWKKNSTLSFRVETSRRRSRRCLLMTLALAQTAVQQGEIHELLALVYYDAIQNVVPIYDQRLVMPSKDAAWLMFCQSSMRHFKKAFSHKEDWSLVFYLGKLCEKLGYSHEMSFSFYDKAISLNQTAVDPFYRLHASRLKLLYTCGKQDKEALKAVSAYSYNQETKVTAMAIFGDMESETSELASAGEEGSRVSNSDNIKRVGSQQLEGLWHMLYNDCLYALEICIEGDLKHFHKARYMLAQGFYRRGDKGDLEKARDELSFCFKSSRSSFTYNMWEIDGMVKKGRRKTPSVSGNKRALEVNLPESSRKFITSIRKYILFYLKLLEETGDTSTLERAYISIRADKRFSLCLEDLVPVAVGRYAKSLTSSIYKTEIEIGGEHTPNETLLEKIFTLYMEQLNLWSDICSLPEIECPELSESSLYGYLYQYIQTLERNVKLETLEGINEKIRKRLKNPKLSNSNFAKVYKHVSVAWCRSLVIRMALITPLHSRISSDIQVSYLLSGALENTQLLCVDLQTDELWTSSLEDTKHLKTLELQWNPIVSKIKNVIIKKASEEDLETATTLLRSCYNFYKDTSCAMLPSGINLYTVPSQLASETYIQPGIDGVDIIDMSTSRKLILWAYTLLHGHYTSISVAIKYCEEHAKSKLKKGTGVSSIAPSPSTAIASTCHPGDGKDRANKCDDSETPPSTAIFSSQSETENARNVGSSSLSKSKTAIDATPSLPETRRACTPDKTSLVGTESTGAEGLASLVRKENNAG
ncbi:calcineurin-binding protein 1 [Apium graveolens]|uniref:calcineurin-binding protein 1 n=1 Tax=Apium graveolens TaxID=4045 RepID=UPI003D7B0948